MYMTYSLLMFKFSKRNALVSGHFPNGLSSDERFPEDISPKDSSSMDSSPNRQFLKRAFPCQTFP